MQLDRGFQSCIVFMQEQMTITGALSLYIERVILT